MLRMVTFVIASILAVAVPLDAQEAEPDGEDDDIEVITVTIRKREESIQDVPATVSAFSGEMLQQVRFDNVNDVASRLAGVVAKGEGRTGAISIRGVSEGFTGQASVARHINGVFQRDGVLGYTGMYYDLRSIEITRGPAGTVYGRNATAGAMNLIWNAPEPEWHALGDVTMGNHDRRRVRGVVNVPLLGEGDERLMARFVVQRDVRDGYLNDDFQSERDDIMNLDEWYLRGALRSRITEDVTLDLRSYYTHSNAYTNGFRPLRDDFPVGSFHIPAPLNVTYPFDWANGLQQFKAALLASPSIWRLAARTDFLAGLFPDLNSALEDVLLTGRDFDLDGNLEVPPLIRSPEFFTPALPIHGNPLRARTRLVQNWGHRPELTIYAGDGALDWNLGDFSGIGSLDFRIVGGYQFLEILQLSDADGTELAALDSVQHHTRHSYTFDAQLLTQGESIPLDLALGFFYFRHTDDRPNQHAFTPLGDFPSSEFRELKGIAPYFNASARPLELLADDPPLDLELFAGVRWNKDSEFLDQTNVATGLRPGASLAGKVTFREVTWEVGTRWRITEQHLLYGKFSTNYKPGIQQLDLTENQSAPVAPEHIDAWELGWKANWWDRRLDSALTVFRYSYVDLQVPQLINNQVFTENAAAAENWGIELDLDARPTDELLLQASVGLLKARFKEFCADDPSVNQGFDDPGCTREDPSSANSFNGLINNEGNDLEDAPEWKIALFGSYAFDLGARGALRPVVKFTYTDHYSLRPFNLAMDHVEAYTRTDVALRWESADGGFSVEAYADNLENNVVFARTTVGPDFLGGFPASVGVLPPRMYGIRLGFDWRRE